MRGTQALPIGGVELRAAIPQLDDMVGTHAMIEVRSGAALAALDPLATTARPPRPRPDPLSFSLSTAVSP